MADDGVIESVASPLRLFVGPAVRAVLAVAWIALALSDDHLRVAHLVIGVVWTAAAAVAARAAYRSRGQVALHVGPDGITGTLGRRLDGWGGVAMVWVGYVPRFRLLRGIRSPRIKIYTRSGLHFARRADTDVRPAVTFVVPAALPAEFCARLRTFTPALVVDGDVTSRWSAERSVERS